jgi:DNA-binding transcriptional LysR family regulator
VLEAIADRDDSLTMELRHLEYFVVVAEELSFTRASRRLHVVQSGVSAAIKSLERELAAPLFDRSPRRVTLSDAGAALLPRARATLDAAQSARDAVQQVRGGLRGTLTVGTMTAVGLLDVPALLGQFHAEHPAVTLQLRMSTTTGSAGLATSLLHGELDLAFLSLPARPPSGLRWQELAATPIVLVVRADHRLADLTTATLGQLADERFVDFPAGYGNRVVVDRTFAAAGMDRHVTIEVADMTTAADCVAEGLGIAFLPAIFVPADPRLRVLTVAGRAMRWNVCIASAKARHPSAAAQALLRLVDHNMPTTANDQPR